MFTKILIANRGEIACRIIKTARALGIRTVAIYSDADKDALHVDMADEAYAIGPPEAAQSYLAIDKIVAACRTTGAQAVHPGYGFLSERPAFATALAEANIAFIGPNVRAIAAMGDKIQSKKFANAANVSTVPGFLGVITDVAHASSIADGLGYPVMIKASAGGGGKGMRIAHSRQEVAEGFERARSEAQSSFGDDRLFIEKFIVNPRHIEIQILADKHGNVIHLGERECSIQRRNQKVIEEAPSPLLDAATRQAMGAQGVALAKAVEYDSAGTVEFVADQNRNFYFLEMNTRLQVEHPVTELVTGVDLVEQMIRVAAGERLTIAQDDVKLAGWAVETRIYAEDPARNFLPSTGRIIRYRPPAEQTLAGVTVRNDSGVFEGGEISIYYDPMIAKLVTHAPDRAQAIAAQSEALDRYVIDGIRHNIPFLASVMQNERWASGHLSTNFITEEYGAGFSPPPAQGETAHRMAAIAASLDHVMNRRRRFITGQMRDRSRFAFERDRVVMLGTQRFDVTLTEADKTIVVHRGGGAPPYRLTAQWVPGDPVWHGTVNDSEYSLQVRSLLNGFQLDHRGISVSARVYTRREAELAALMREKASGEATKALLCPMPGLIRAILVSVGQAVKRGETLCMVEAMKMENVLRAERDVTIKKIVAKEGDSLAVDAVIMEFA
jgi:propionyl-CoA carboxylase alpha chain